MAGARCRFDSPDIRPITLHLVRMLQFSLRGGYNRKDQLVHEMIAWLVGRGLLGVSLAGLGVSLAGLGVSLAGWWTSWLLARRREVGHDADAVVRLTPVPAETQHAVVALLREGRTEKATVELRRVAKLSLRQATVAVRLLKAGTTLPVTYDNAAARVRNDYPDLATRLTQVIREEGSVAAIRCLRQQIPLGLLSGKRLVEAFEEAPH